jgi:hypothetical protein
MGHSDAHVDEAMVHAWLDGALGADEAARVAAHVEQCAACGAVVAEARGLIAAATRILSTLDNVPAGVVPARRAPVAWYRGWPVRVAASLVVAVVGGLVVVGRVQRIAPSSVERAPEIVATPAAPPPAVASAPMRPQVKAATKPRVPRVAAAPLPQPAPAPSVERANADSVVREYPAAAAAGARFETLRQAKQAVADSPACYDLVQSAALPLPQRVVLDTVSVGDSNATLRHVARVGPPESTLAAYWTAPAPDSVEVVVPDKLTLVGHVTSRGLTGVAAGRPFTARRCVAR